jgi:fumarate reductase flavoprotein subunit
LTWDLIVVGGGVAGWTAARRAQQLGLRTLVLEKHGEAPGFGNGRISGGWFHAAYLDPKAHTPDELFAAIRARTDGDGREDVARAWSANCRRALEFLEAEGAVFERWGPEEHMTHVITPFASPVLGQPWEGAGPDLLLSGMARRHGAAGGGFEAGARATELVTVGTQVVGVVAETTAGRRSYEARAVLLCDGGFQANPDLVHKFITPVYLLRGSPNDTGDALRMGLAAGAAAVNLSATYCQCQHRDALHNHRLWPSPGAQSAIDVAILVNGRGERITDEGLGNNRSADAIAKSDTPGECWTVFDSAVWATECTGGSFPLNPTLEEEGARIVIAGSIEELSRLTLLPGLVATVDAFNRHVREGASVTPQRTGRALPIERAPFYALPLICGITFTMGGLLVNGDAQVLDQAERPIAGLYAAGGSMGGLQGGPRVGYSGGWAEASTFGLLAAEHAANAARVPA